MKAPGTGEVDLPKDPHTQSELAWHQLKAKRGWSEGTLVMLMHEFIKSKGLFADLIKFVNRR